MRHIATCFYATLSCDHAVVENDYKSVLATWIVGFLKEIGTKMNSRKHSASRGSRKDAPPPQPPPKRRTSRRRGPNRVGNVGESRPLTEDDIPRIIQGVVQSLTAPQDYAPLEAVILSTSGSRTTQCGRNGRGRPLTTPSSLRSALATGLDESATQQRESSQSPAAPLLNANMCTESSSSPATVPIIPSSSSPAAVPTIPSAVR